MQEEIKIAQNQKKQFGLFLMAIIMVAASIFVFFSDVEIIGGEIIGKIIGLVGILFFGFCLIFIAKRLFNPKDILIINENGIMDNSTAISLGFIAWSEIKSMYKKKMFTQEFLCIDILNYEERIKGMLFIKRLLIKANKKMGYSPISITLQSTKHTVDEVLEVINKYREKHLIL